jgi:hypothetical protein
VVEKFAQSFVIASSGRIGFCDSVSSDAAAKTPTWIVMDLQRVTNQMCTAIA